MADTKWSDFPAASSVADADYTAVVQGGVNKRSAMSVIKGYIQAAFDAIYAPLARTLNIGGSTQSLAANRTWTSTTILDGVGSPMQGDILYRGASSWAYLTPGTNGNFLTTHGASANPTWTAGASFTAGNLTDAGTDGITVTGGTNAVNGSGTSLSQHVADGTHNGYLSSADWTSFSGASTGTPLTKTDDTNVTLTLGGAPSTALVHAASLTLGWTGTLATGRGGTGVSSLGNITKTDDTNVTLTLGGTPTGAVINATSFTLGWTGTLSVARGGSGAGTLTGLLVGNGTSAFTTVTAPSGAVVGTTDTQTLTNKRVNPRVTSITSNATWSPSADTDDVYEITAQAAAATTISNPSGTPVDGQKLIIRVKDNGTARALTWSGSQWRASSDLALPTTTVLSKTLYLGFIYNSADTKWDLLALLNNF